MQKIDQAKIQAAIVACDVAPAVKEHAAEIVEQWITKFHVQDSLERTLAVEAKFFIQIDKLTWVIGIVDRMSVLASSVQSGVERRFVLNEWKTTREATKFFNEDKWLAEILSSLQLATYGLALREGTFRFKSEGTWKLDKLSGRKSAASVLVRVRAAVKSRPVSFWPSGGEDVFEITAERMESARVAYLNMARVIRTLRSLPNTPWQSTGKQCWQFGGVCPLFADCSDNKFASGAIRVLQPDDAWLAEFGVKLGEIDPRVVILSPSSYDLATLCLEKYRALKVVDPPKEEEESSPALDLGKVCHAGWAAYYSQL